MINNYKAQRNVRAELGGAVDLGEPVSLYIAEDEVKVTGNNIIENGDFETGSVLPWANGDMDTFEISTDHATGTYSLHLTVGDADDIAYVDFPTKVGSQYVLRFNRTIPNHDSGSSVKYKLGHSGDSDAYTTATASDNITTGRFREEIIFTATVTTSRLSVVETGTQNDANVYIDDIQCYEISDHTYKLMAVNDNIPATSVNTEGLGSELITNGTFTDWSGDNPDNWTVVGESGSDPMVTESSGKARLYHSSGGDIRVHQDVLTIGKKYYYSFDITANSAGSLKLESGSGEAYVTGITTVATHTGTFTADHAQFRIRRNSSSGTDITIDNVSLKEYYGYDYYNAPAYKFGIVSSVYDQDTGAMKTTGAAGDQVDVTVQGECILRKSGTYTINADRIISRITSASVLSHATPSSDYYLPNSVAVTSEQTSSSNTQPIILWQGVEFSEHFVHKNSLQVHAKCDEAITKFRPVSLFLDSNGDLLCRHDDIPETEPDADTDHTGVDPGKWGIAELGGASGDIIPVTVAGKTHINTSNTRTVGTLLKRIGENGSTSVSVANNDYTPNALGTFMESGTGDVPITIFGGTPIGTITNWKRTIKVTAKANGAVTQHCPVSLYLDQWGDYRCISDNIPNGQTAATNDEWVDFRKWGVAQTTVADGEFVEIIVQGRTNVVDTITHLERKDFVNKIAADGSCRGDSSTARALSTLGIVEKEAKTSDGTPGVIIIF